MASLWSRLIAPFRRDEVSRSSFDDYVRDWFQFGGTQYPLTGLTQYGQKVEDVENSYGGYVRGAYKANGVVFATVLARLLLFTEARFKFRPYGNPGSGDLFGNQDLAILERPWPNGTTGELLARMEQDVSMGGNFYCVREGDRLRRLRPDWVSIILSEPPDEAVESDVMGYLYRPGGPGSKHPGKIFLPRDACHWSPIPDPEAQYRGMSWLTPVIREIQADGAATHHKLRFFENAATPNLSVSLKETVTLEQFKEFQAAMNEAHQGVDNAYKTMYLGGGAEVKVVGADLRQLDFKQTQGAGETRITAAGGVPAVIVGLSEGLQAATYSNFGQARRKFGDHWARPQWRSACAALSVLVDVPAAAELWYDTRDIAFLREDQADIAEIQSRQSAAIRQLVDAGYDPNSVVKAVLAEDFGLLKHSGLYSVQLQPPGTQAPPADQSPALEPPADESNPTPEEDDRG